MAGILLGILWWTGWTQFLSSHFQPIQGHAIGQMSYTRRNMLFFTGMGQYVSELIEVDSRTFMIGNTGCLGSLIVRVHPRGQKVIRIESRENLMLV